MDNDDLYFEGKYRIPSARLKGWDYRTSADYFITICTRDMIPWFGFVSEGKMNLNELGRFAFEYLQGLNDHKPNVRVINHIIMPNHVHAIITLKNRELGKKANEFGPLLSGSLSALINQYKGRVTKYANTNQLPWGGWQEKFHDHIIKDAASFANINQYISQNPSNWQTDRYFRR
jgi:REP element-mobilizing transposase RayT